MQFLSLSVTITNFPSSDKYHFRADTLYRLVFSQPLLRLFLPSPFKAFSRIHRTHPRSILVTFIICSLVPIAPSPSSILPRPIHLNFLRRHLPSWSTHSGS